MLIFILNIVEILNFLFFFYIFFSSVFSFSVEYYNLKYLNNYFLVNDIYNKIKNNLNSIYSFVFEYKKNYNLNYFLFLNKNKQFSFEKEGLLLSFFFCFFNFIFSFILFFLFLKNSELGLIYYYNNFLFLDISVLVMKIIILFFFCIYFFFLYSLFNKWGFYEFEFGRLVFLIAFGMLIMISANNFFLIYLALELVSISLLLLISFSSTQRRAVEGGIKYFFLSAFFSFILLLSFNFFYLIFGSLDLYILKLLLFDGTTGILKLDNLSFFSLFLIFFSFFFKIGVVPFHFWMPDIYESSNYLVLFFLIIISKIAMIAVILKVIDVFYIFFSEKFIFFYFLGLIPIIYGSILALYQFNIKRFLAYSSINNFGYILLLFGFLNLNVEIYINIYFYLFTYLFGTLLFLLPFIFLTFIERFFIKNVQNFGFENNNSEFSKLISLNDLNSLVNNNYLLSLFFLLILFNLAGMPLSIFFLVKIFIIYSIFHVSFDLVSIFIIIFSSLVSWFYYLRIIKIIFLERTEINKNYYLSCSIDNLRIFSFLISIILFMFIFFLFYFEYILDLLNIFF